MTSYADSFVRGIGASETTGLSQGRLSRLNSQYGIETVCCPVRFASKISGLDIFQAAVRLTTQSPTICYLRVRLHS